MKRPTFKTSDLIFVLSLTALACLPIALSEIVRDAGLSLLLPLTAVSLVLSWLLAGWGARKSTSGLVLLFLGPLFLYVRIGQMGGAFLELVGQALAFILALYEKLFHWTPFDASLLLSSSDEFIQRVTAFNGRLALWVTGVFQGIQIEDPVVRTLIWCLALWLIAVWAGWQISRHRKFMLGMLPSTVVLAFVLDYTGEEHQILWIHLALLLFLYGLTNYHNLRSRWEGLHTDYSDSTAFDTLMMVGVLTLALVSASFFVSTFSIKDILDRFRERREASGEAQAESLGLEAVKDNFLVTGFQHGLPRSYLLKAGPEISKQLAMTITTGDLPSMPQSAHPSVPRYYWRTLTYSIYTSVGWTNPNAPVEDIPVEQALLEEFELPHRMVHAEVTFNGESERLYWTGTLLRANVPFKAAWIRKAADGAPLQSDLLAALANVETYQVDSMLVRVSAEDLRASPSVYPDWVRKRYLTLPDSVPERVLALGRDLTAAEPTPFDRALAIQDYLRQFPYTLEVPAPPPGRDVADYFLFDLKRGYCDYYATSMVVLARAAGLPARLVVGYANGNYSLERAQYLVTENYAHSWAEVYFSNIGWVEFEPTASQPLILYEEQNESSTSAAHSQAAGQPLASEFVFAFQSIFRNAWFPAILGFIFVILWAGFDALRLRRMEPSRTIHILYGRLRRLARPIAGRASSNQTAYSYASILVEKLSALEKSSRLRKWLTPSHTEIQTLTDLFSYSLFAPHPSTRADANSALKNWSRLKWRLVLENVLRVVNKWST